MLKKHDVYAARDFLSKMTRGQRYHNAVVDKRNITSDLVYTIHRHGVLGLERFYQYVILYHHAYFDNHPCTLMVLTDMWKLCQIFADHWEKGMQKYMEFLPFSAWSLVSINIISTFHPSQQIYHINTALTQEKSYLWVESHTLFWQNSRNPPRS